MNTEDTFFELEMITVKINYEPHSVQVMDYVTAKTKDLQQFGYNSLTEEQVLKSLKRVINKEKLVDVIDHFIKEDIVLD